MDYVRGFSYMPSNKVEVVDIQDALDRTWRNTRRERLKQREQKIWEEFVKESDIVNTVCEDDQYQFLDELPESRLQELLEAELLKMNKEKPIVQEPKVQETTIQEEHTVVNSLNIEKDDCDLFQIFDDEKDDHSGMEDGTPGSSPPTVREVKTESPEISDDIPLERPSSESTTLSTTKSSENFTNVIESSIYCAKVKDLRIKINEEILDMVNLLDRRELFSMEKDDIARMIKRSAEFCGRFNRIYMYQLHRQIQDIKRNNNLTLPFAKHTQFQSQMVRIVSLHQNLLQSFQVFRKSVDQTCCVRESVSAVGALLGAARGASQQCAAVAHPPDLAAAQLLYEDNLLSSCDKLEQFVNEYAVRCEEFLMGYANVIKERTKKSREEKKSRKRPLLNLRNASKSNSETDSRLSMYSLGTVRLNTRPSSSKDMQGSVTDKRVHSPNEVDTKPELKSPKPRRKSPRSRRPLMRDPQAGKARAPRPARAARDDISTLVESVAPCTSSHMLTDYTSPQRPQRRSKANSKDDQNRKSTSNTPRKHKIGNLKASQQPGNQEPITSKHSPSSKVRTGNKNSQKEGKPKEEEKKKELEENVNQDNDSDSVKSVTIDSGTKDTKSKSQKSLIKLEPIKSVLVRPANMKVDTNVHSEAGEPQEPESKPEPIIPESPKPEVLKSPHSEKSFKATREEKKEKSKKLNKSPDRCEVTRLLQQLCSGDTSGVRTERTTGSKNAQLLYVNGTSPRSQPSTPQLLRILEETIQKKVPRSLLKKPGNRDVEKYRLAFNIGESVSDNMFQYRTKFVQHMLTSPMYANSSVGKPWEMIGSVSEQIIDELLINCVKDMEVNDYVCALYKRETT